MRWKKVYPKGSRGVQTQPIQTAYIPGEQRPPRHDAVRIGAALALVLFGLIGVLSWFTTEGALMNGFRVVAAGLLGWGFYPVPVCLFLAAYWLGLHRDRPCTRKVICTLVIAAMFGAFMHLAECGEEDLLRLGAMTDMTLTDVVLQLGKNGIALESHCGGILSGFAAVLLYTCLRRVIGCIVLILAAVPVFVYAFGGDFRKIIVEAAKLYQKLKAQRQAAQLAREHRMQEIAAAEEARRAQEETGRAAEEESVKQETAEKAEAMTEAAPESESAPAQSPRRSLFDDDPALADLLSDIPSVKTAPVSETEGPDETEGPAAAEKPVEPEKSVEAEEPVESEEPVETGEPVETEESAKTEEPVETEEPAETEEPVETEETVVAEEPVTAEEKETVLSEEMTGSEKPAESELPAEKQPASAPEFVRLDPEDPETFRPAAKAIPEPEPEPEPEPDPADRLMQSLHRRQEPGKGSRRMYDEEWEEKKDRLFSAAELLEDEPEEKPEEKPEKIAEPAVPVSFVRERDEEPQPDTAAEEKTAEKPVSEEETAPAEETADEEKPEERRPRSSGRFEFIIMSNDPKPKRRSAKDIWDELDS